MTNQTKRPKGTKITTPFGRSGFSCLVRPSTKFNPDGEFNAKIILNDGPETAEFLEKLKALYEQAYQTNLAEARAKQPKLPAIKRADPPFKRVVDEDTGEELPQWSINARMRAVRRDKAIVNPDGTKSPGPILGHNKPVVLDSKNQPVYTEIGNGSIMRFQALALPFFTAALGSGLQLKLIGVQIKDLVPFAGFKPDFDEVDGFVETAQAPPPASQNPQAARNTPAVDTNPTTMSGSIDTTSEDSAEWV